MDILLSNILISAKNYLLKSNDERMMFDWLVLKQHDFGLAKSFRHSVPQIQEETKIARYSQEKITQRFVDMGFLTVGKVYHQNNPYRSFFVDFSVLSKPELLGQLVKPGTDTYNSLISNFSHWANEQKKEMKPLSKKQRKEAETEVQAIEALFPRLVEQWNERVDMYNNGELTQEKPSRSRVYVASFVPTKNAKMLMGKLRVKYPDEAIIKAFMVYADEIMRGKIKTPKSILLYFLTCNEGEFDVVNNCYNYYVTSYGRSV